MIAVLSNNSIYMFHGFMHDAGMFPIPGGAPITLLDTVTLMNMYDVDTLWIMPYSTTSQNAKLYPHLFMDAEGYECRVSHRGNKAIRGVRLWRKGATGRASRTLRIIFLAHAARWGMDKENDPQAVLYRVARVQEAIGIPLELSPGSTARSLVKAMCEPRYIAQDRGLIPPETLPEVFPVPPQWKRPLTSEEMANFKYLAIYDKNAQYLKACTGVELGVGNVVKGGHNPNIPPASQWFKERQPGLWDVAIYPADYGELDSVFEGFAWTPYIHYMKRKGYAVVFRENFYVWPEHHAVLRPWAEKLWNARQTLQDDPACVSLIKNIYTQGLGWLNMREERNTGEVDTLHRPDWDALVKDHAYMLIRMKIDYLLSQNFRVVWANIDEIGLLTNVPTNAAAIVGDGYKLKYGKAIELNEVIEYLFSEQVAFHKCSSELFRIGNSNGL